LFVCSVFRSPRDLLSFPTRRSSDLAGWLSRPAVDALPGAARHRPIRWAARRGAGAERLDRPLRAGAAQPARDLSGIRRALRRRRSEEHTSELQSRENLVCRLLLEKK